MSRLESFERLIESVVEDSLFNRLHTRGHPVEIAKRLARTMEDETCIWSDGRFVAPDKYVVQLRPEAYGVYQNVRDIIEQDLAEYIQNAAGEKKPPVYFLTPPTIRLETSRDIGRRRILVKAYWGEDNHKREAGSPSEVISEQAIESQGAQGQSTEQIFERIVSAEDLSTDQRVDGFLTDLRTLHR